ncbi:MAG: lipopolysaccharide biosynthesis protein [Bacteroidetes bacterium]|nr:lipopolysaccharide biosynthesis protein [Bacteroidota bacterium]
MDNLKKKTITGLGFDLINRFSRQGINFVITVFLARILSPSDFGLVAIVNVVIIFASDMNQMGLGSAIVQKKDAKDEDYGSVFYFNMAAGILLTTVIFSIAGPVSRFYDHPELKQIMRVMSFTFIINSFCMVRVSWLRKHLKFPTITISSLVALVVGGTVGIVMAYRGYGVWCLVAQSLISALVNNLCIYFLTKWKPVLIFKWQALKNLWKYGIHMFGVNVLDTFSSQLDNLIIGKLFSPVTLGFYNRAKSLNTLVSDYSSGGLMTVFFPVLSSIQDDKERFEKVVFRFFHFVSFTSFFMSGFFYLCAKDFIVILFTAKWIPAIEYYKIMVLAGFVYPLSVVLVNIITSKGNSRVYLRLNIIKKSFLLLNFIIGFYFGIEGFLYGLVLVSFINLSLNIIFAANEMEVKAGWFFSIFWKYLLADVFIIFLFYVFQDYWTINNYWLHIIVFGSLFAAAYFTVTKLMQLEGQKLFVIELKKLNITGRLGKLFR